MKPRLEVLGRRRTGLAVLGAALVVVAGAAFAQGGKPIISAPEAISISAQPIVSFEKAAAGKTHYGELEWRGGLVLSSSSPHFGGFSGLAFDSDGTRFLAVSDAGAYLVGTLSYKGRAPKGVEGAKLGPILALSGRPLTANRDRDAEAVALADGSLSAGTALIAFERNDRIGTFPLLKGELGKPSSYMKKASDMRRLRNEGLEAMTVMRGGRWKGAVIGIAEEPIGSKPGHTGWLWVDGEPKSFTIAGQAGFSITDVATLADGTVFLLERRFRWFEGVKMRLCRLAAGKLKPGAVVEPELLLAADMGQEIDNMEGLAARQTEDGEVLLTLISDDNFNSILQRTVLLEFALPAKRQTAE